MSEGIPEHVDLIRAAKLGSHFCGSISIDRMLRLSDSLANKEGQIDVDIKVGTERNRAFLRGQASGKVWVVCQRCMQDMQQNIAASFELVLVESEHKLEGIPDDVDALLITEVPSSLINIIEDELILGFPLVPMHKVEECEATIYMRDERNLQDKEECTEKSNPFAVLKDFKIDA